jgi:hypothetical protein
MTGIPVRWRDAAAVPISPFIIHTASTLTSGEKGDTMSRAKRGQGAPLSMQQIQDSVDAAGLGGFVEIIKRANKTFAWAVKTPEKQVKIHPIVNAGHVVTKIGDMCRDDWVVTARRAYLTHYKEDGVCFIIISGNAFTGYQYFGPFGSEDAAFAWGTAALKKQQYAIVKADDKGGKLCV